MFFLLVDDYSSNYSKSRSESQSGKNNTIVMNMLFSLVCEAMQVCYFDLTAAVRLPSPATTGVKVGRGPLYGRCSTRPDRTSTFYLHSSTLRPGRKFVRAP